MCWRTITLPFISAHCKLTSRKYKMLV